MFGADTRSAPLMLLALIGLGVLAPLGAMGWVLLRGEDYTGPNKVHKDTINFYLWSKFCVKESQVREWCVGARAWVVCVCVAGGRL